MCAAKWTQPCTIVPSIPNALSNLGAAALASLRRGARFELFFDEPGDVFQHA